MNRFKYLNVEGNDVNQLANQNPITSSSPAAVPVPAGVLVDTNKKVQMSRSTQYAMYGTAIGAITGVLMGKNVFYSALWGLGVGAATGFFLGANKKVTTPIDAAIAEAKTAIEKGEKLSQPLIDKLKNEYNKLVASVPQGTKPAPAVVDKASQVKQVLTDGGAILPPLTASVQTY